MFIVQHKLGSMKKKIELKFQAVNLREKGYSLNEIINKVGVSKSTASIWVRNVVLNDKARKRLLTKIKKGQLLGGESKRRIVENSMLEKVGAASHALKNYKLDNTGIRLICALLYYCEGVKDHHNGVRFTNSDPKVIRLFLKLFRQGFAIDERKLRMGVHLHEYHNKVTILKLWSNISKIPLKQFIKPYLKANTGKRIRDNYPGCATVYYYNNDMGRELLSIAHAFFNKTGA